MNKRERGRKTIEGREKNKVKKESKEGRRWSERGMAEKQRIKRGK